jgi:ribonuclease R
MNKTNRPPKRGKAKMAAKSQQKQAPFPTRDEILAFIRDNPGAVGKRDISRAFRLTAAQRIELKQVLRDLKQGGAVAPGGHRRVHAPSPDLAEIAALIVDGTDEDGAVALRPQDWPVDMTPPAIALKPLATDREVPRDGSRILARLHRREDGSYEAGMIRLLDEGSPRVVGVFRTGRQGARVELTDRKARGELVIEPGYESRAEPGDLVLVELVPAPRYGLKRGRIKEIIGKSDDPRCVSLIAIASREIPTDFPLGAISEAEAATVPELGQRTDLRHIPLVTIDGEDARDFDDAVFAEPDSDAENEGGWHLLVAIADVSHYVRPGSALDREAYKRGNSVYFPDRVVPMLPEALSNGLCSLKPKEPRACMAFEMWIAKDGRLLRHKLVRGLMRSVARLTYNQVQAARNGSPDDTTGPLMAEVIEPLYGAYAALSVARQRRGTLELDLPERKVTLGADGKIASISERERLESHKLIEEFMILANVAAAEMAGKAQNPTLYRIHDRPDSAKLDLVREFIRDLGFNLAKGQVVKPAHLTQLLQQAAGTPHAPLINDVVLRAQATAIYSPDNIGHFGLALRNYAHFTSPIRRYADLIVHRTLIRLAHLGEDGLTPDETVRLEAIGEHISQTERRAAEAERDAISRYTAAFMADHIGGIFQGRISGVSRFGLFVKLDGNGAEGLIPISTLPGDFYVHEEAKHRLVGRRSGRTYQLAQRVTVKLREADGLTGSTLFGLMGEDGEDLPVRAVPERKGRGGRR